MSVARSTIYLVVIAMIHLILILQQIFSYQYFAILIKIEVFVMREFIFFVKIFLCVISNKYILYNIKYYKNLNSFLLLKCISSLLYILQC